MKNAKGKFFKYVLVPVLILSSVVRSGFINAKSIDDNFGVSDKIINTSSDLNTDIPKTSVVDGVAGFGTEGANGRIWVDKSVTDKTDGNFNVKLSALTQEFTSTKSGSASSIAADVIFILDGSGSMIDENSNDIKDGNVNLNRLQAMIKATNESIDIIMKANSKNRVAVYMYNGDDYAGVVLPMDSYTIGNRETSYLVWGPDYTGYDTTKFMIYYNKTMKKSNGNLFAPPNSNPVLSPNYDKIGGATPRV